MTLLELQRLKEASKVFYERKRILEEMNAQNSYEYEAALMDIKLLE